MPHRNAAELQTNQHCFEFHAIGILHTTAILKSPPQILLTCTGDTCQLKKQLVKTSADQIGSDGVMKMMSTLVQQTRAGTCILQKRQQKWLHNIRAAMESCENIHQPPSSLTAVPTQKDTHTHTHSYKRLSTITSPLIKNK